MKAGIAHTVPLSGPAIAALDRVAEVRRGDLIFPGTAAPGRPMAGSTVAYILKGHEASFHGFRSSFRDWAAENGVSHEIAESCLAHITANAVVRAYRRTDFLQQRQEVMERWSAFCTGGASRV